MTKIKETQITEETKGTNYEVDIRNIKPLNRAGGNIRLDYGYEDGSFNELVSSIEANGVLVPIRAFRDKDNEGDWIAIDGHRRLSAAMKLYEEKGLIVRVKINVVDSRKISDEQMIIDMVVTNSGKPLSPIELSDAVHRLTVLEYKPKDIADKFGMEIHAIKNLALLGSAPKRIRNLISSNVLSYSTALSFLKSSHDFNDAIDKIDKALSMVERSETNPESKKGGKFNTITRNHLDAVNNKVNSSEELKRVFKNLIDKPKTVVNQELYSFAKKIIENRVTASDIEKLLF